MDAANLHRNTPQDVGVLVLQTGRQAGARRPLGVPTTFLGRGPGCDIRLNVDRVDPLHCLLVCGPDGVQVRDLDSTEGTYVNGTRTDQALLGDGDILKIGPFQFRLELAPAAPRADDRSMEEMREALRIQAAAVAAQQAGLEEEEMRLQQRKSELQQQEEQLAAHLDEKQRQVQLWADYTKAEREALRKEKAEQEKHLAKLEKELWQAKEEMTKERQEVTQARQRIDKVYQRLRTRWQRQWAGEREKHQQVAGELATERAAIQDRERALHVREAVIAQEIVRASSERELALCRLRDGRAALKKDQDSWRSRRSQEQLVLKARARELEETQIKVKHLRLLLVQEKDAWDKQQDSLQKELYGLNNRIVHLRLRVQEQQEEIARLDTALRERRLQIVSPAAYAVADDDGVPDALEIDDCEVEVLADTAVISEPSDPSARRCTDLDRLAGELADQRAHLIEQYKRLAVIHDAWQQQRDTAAAELETLASRLTDEEQALAEREQHTSSAEESVHERTRETEAVRQELQLWRAQLNAREQTFVQQHQQETLVLRQHQALLQEQLGALAALRQRWNLRRQQEIDRLQAERTVLSQEQKQAQERRLVLFEKSQQIDVEKRILAEKALALEQYRQEVFVRAKDPSAQRRVERLRRRWLTLNSTLIRNARSAAEITKKELAELEAVRAELTQASSRLTQAEAALADKQTQAEAVETSLNIRQQELDLELRKLQSPHAENDIEMIAQGIYEEPDASAIDRAA
jgi:pSer/pThr/pTyr-binding forkhead associated (FHA) protein